MKVLLVVFPSFVMPQTPGRVFQMIIIEFLSNTVVQLSSIFDLPKKPRGCDYFGQIALTVCKGLSFRLVLQDFFWTSFKCCG